MQSPPSRDEARENLIQYLAKQCPNHTFLYSTDGKIICTDIDVRHLNLGDGFHYEYFPPDEFADGCMRVFDIETNEVYGEFMICRKNLQHRHRFDSYSYA